MTVFSNTVSFIFETARKHPKVLAMRDDHANPPVKMNYEEMCEATDILASGFLQLGIQKDSRIAFFADNQPRWKLVDYALMSINAVSVPRGSDSAIAELWFIIKHSEAQIAVLQDCALANRMLQSEDAIQLDTIIIIDSKSKQQDLEDLAAKYDLRVISFDQVMDLGRQYPQDIDVLRQTTDSEVLATLVYTSGTTGTPKGVMLTHANLISQLRNVDVGLLGYPPGMLQMAILPAWHAYERMAEYFVSYQTACTLLYSNKRHLKSDIANLKPAIIPCVPRIWEMIYDNIRSQVQKQSKAKQRLFHFFVHTGKSYIIARRKVFNLQLSKTRLSVGSYLKALTTYCMLAPVYFGGKRLIFDGIKSKIASNLLAAVSGGGSLATYIDDFFETVGINLLNGYGLTETSPVIAIRQMNHNVRGTVGLPIGNTQIEIRSEEGNVLSQGKIGTIWVKGPQIMSGYYRNEQETRKVIADGWFNTGDLGYFCVTGDLVISGRSKDTIVLSSGENIEPEPIEGFLRESPLITDIVVVGQDRKVLGALIYPSIENLAKSLGLPEHATIQDLVSHPKADDVVRQEVMQMMKTNGSFKEYEIVTKIYLIAEQFSEANGLLTQTLKPKRNPISSYYAREIEAMYR